MKKYHLQMRPIPKGRPRLNPNTGRVITPERTRQFEKEFKNWLVFFFGKEIELTENKLHVDLEFHFKTKSKKCGYKDTKPDIDNLCKSALDAMNGIIFKDDSQIVELSARKYYSFEDKIIIGVKEV